MSAQHLLDHPAFLYTSLDHYIDVMAPYVQTGIDNNEAVFVAARGDYLAPLQSALRDPDGAAQLVDTYEWEPHPSTRLRAFKEFITDRLEAGVTRIRLAGEPVWTTEDPAMRREWQRYESVLNRVLSPYPVSLVCLYDASTLDSSILQGAQQTHPAVAVSKDHQVSVTFTPPETFLRTWNHELTPTPRSAHGIADVPDAAMGRHFLEREARSAGVAGDTVEDLCVAANEVLTNAFVHAEGARLATWTDGNVFVCEIENRGEALVDALAGYRPPGNVQEGGRGLWLARQLVYLLQIFPTDRGTTFRLYVRR